MKEFFTAAEILDAGSAALPRDRGDLNKLIQQRGWRNDASKARQTGGVWEYHFSLLPIDAQSRLLCRFAPAPLSEPERAATADSKALWERFNTLPDKQKDEARRRLQAVDLVETLSVRATRHLAVVMAARETGVSTSTLWGWLRLVDGVPAEDRLPALAPKYAGRTATAECHPQAWSFLVADYLRPEQPSFEACFRRLQDAAAKYEWSPIPSAKTLKRRIERDLPRAARVMARKGADAVKAAYPHQTRDRSVFHAMQAVNADGHKFDVFTKWPDGEISRPVLLAIQDVYSGMIVAHRIDRSENWTVVRMAFADLLEAHGIPEHAYFDNGRHFASKWLAGGIQHRYRFKVKDEEPTGILKMLGIQIHWTTPYHGQAKPIERAFRDLCDEIAKHPACAGAYTGNRPEAKPANYRSRAIDIEAFRALVAAEIHRHNARSGRRTPTARGRSFAETFADSLQAPETIVRTTNEHQRRLFLMAAEGVTADRRTGEVKLAGNRYWSPRLSDRAGEKLVVRFDPQDLSRPVAVYTRDGRYLCEADRIEAIGFNDMDAAREHARNRRNWLRAQREQLDIERRMSIQQVADLLPPPEPLSVPTSKVVRLTTGAAAARVSEHDVWSESSAENFARALQMRQAQDADVLPLARKEEGGRA